MDIPGIHYVYVVEDYWQLWKVKLQKSESITRLDNSHFDISNHTKQNKLQLYWISKHLPVCFFVYLKHDCRLYAMNFNHMPPYLAEKWHLSINLTHGSNATPSTNLLTLNSNIYISGAHVSNSYDDTTIISDKGTK